MKPAPDRPPGREKEAHNRDLRPCEGVPRTIPFAENALPTPPAGHAGRAFSFGLQPSLHARPWQLRHHHQLPIN
jgi:hypothetical protein